ncbi:MAG: cyclopropane-fatty-acyl-phospholipid synthase [Betaproteobacteria bacterium RIFCSPLOWO2_02_FULL_65_24]|nr:MAG: cyclopropane-fatty-acyl-phospholipid synthase [Betaproteobacteria bacterium RIFCSPLOWO2_02_FULL_65_24]OGA33701.1 MAG: cyclopropane-fatty-acyl-phospholipid synthase [Betaproteobacteria bacterium RIFCSPLOWO2_12_FULL_62_13b]
MIRKKMFAIGRGTKLCFRVHLPDGSSYQSGDGEPAVTVTFKNVKAELQTVLFGHVGFLEAYFAGDIDIDGDFPLAFRAGMDAGFDRLPSPLVVIRNAWHELRFSNRSIAQAKANARFHYGIGAGFYRYWLDVPAMMYTCGYWKEGTRTLEEAQRNKMDHVCAKVGLKPGETFVDIGCGWGGLLFHAWEHYGARGTGVNITTEQVYELREEMTRRGLADRISVLECDFRQIPGQFDKLLSIGTLEHAGRDELGAVIRAHADAMKPGALGVIHFIGHIGVRRTEFYIRKHIFPGGWIPSLAQAITEMENCGLEVVDIENLRRHYALTLDEWGRRFDRHWDEIRLLDPSRFDEYFRRKWRTYLYTCAEMFRSPHGRTHLFQVVVSKGNLGSAYPMSRTFLYERAQAEQALEEA